MRLRRIVCVLASVLALVSVVEAGEGVRQAPDNDSIMVSKDVGNERWSIQLDLDTGALTGNVFRTSGDPAFVWCAVDRITGNVDDIYNTNWFFSCFGADACRPWSCSQWSYLTNISLPGAFFLPR